MVLNMVQTSTMSYTPLPHLRERAHRYSCSTWFSENFKVLHNIVSQICTRDLEQEN